MPEDRPTTSGNPDLDTGIEPTDNETLAWLNEQRRQATALHRDGVVQVTDPETKQSYWRAQMISPEFYKEHIAGREELIGWGPKSAYGDQADVQFGRRQNIRPDSIMASPVVQMPEVDPDILARIYQHVADHWDQLPMDDPEISYLYALNPMLLFADAEVAGSTADTQAILGGLDSPFDIATETARFFLGEYRTIYSFESVGDTLSKTASVGYFFDDFGQYFSRPEIDLITTGFAHANIDHRENLAALAWHWWNSEDKPRDPKSDQDRAEFINFFYARAEQAADNTKFENGFWGKVFDDVDDLLGGEWMRQWLRRRVLPGMAGEDLPEDWTNSSLGRIMDEEQRNLPSNFTYQGSIENPKSYAMRSNLTLGQQIALYVTGVDDLESRSFSLLSGTVDGISQFITPGEMAAAFASGGTSTASKVVRVAAPNLSRAGRLRLAAKVAIPWFGKRISIDGVRQVGLPTGISRRVGWALASKSVDEFLDMASKAGVMKQMHEAIQNRGWGYAVRNFPNLERIAADEQLNAMLSSAESAEEFEWLYRMVAKGTLDESHATKLADLRARMAELRGRLDEMEVTIAGEDVLPADALLFFRNKGRKGFKVPRSAAGVGGRIDEALTGATPRVNIASIADEGTEEDIIVRVLNVDKPVLLDVEEAAKVVDSNIERSDLSNALLHRFDEAPSEVPSRNIRFETKEGEVLGEADFRFPADGGMSPSMLDGYATAARGEEGVTAKATQVEASQLWGFQGDVTSRGIDLNKYNPVLIEYSDGKWGVSLTSAVEGGKLQNVVLYDSAEEALGSVAAELRGRRLARDHMLPTRNLEEIMNSGEFETFTDAVEAAYEQAGLLEEAQPFLSALRNVEESFPNLYLLIKSIPEEYWSGTGIQRAAINYQWAMAKKLDDAAEDTSVTKTILSTLFERNWEKGSWTVPQALRDKFVEYLKAADPDFDAKKGMDAAGGASVPKAGFGSDVDVYDPKHIVGFAKWLSENDFDTLQKLVDNSRFVAAVGKRNENLLLDPAFYNQWIELMGDVDVQVFNDVTRRWMHRQPLIAGARRFAGTRPTILGDLAPGADAPDTLLRNLWKAAREGKVDEIEFWDAFSAGLVREIEKINRLGMKARGYGNRAVIPVWRQTTDANIVRNMVSADTTPFIPGDFGQELLRANIGQGDVVNDVGSFWVVVSKIQSDLPSMDVGVIGSGGVRRRMITGELGGNELLIRGDSFKSTRTLKGLPTASIGDSDPKRLVQLWRDGKLRPEQMRVMDEVLSRAGVHGLRNEDGTIAFTRHGIDNSVDVDPQDVNRTVADVTGVNFDGAQAELAQLQATLNRLEYTGQLQILVYDMPPTKLVKLSEYDTGLFGNRLGILDNNRYDRIGKVRRQLNARVFKTAMPSQLDAFDTFGGARDLRRTLRALGMSTENIDKYVDEWYQVAPEAREELVKRAFKEEGRRTGNKLLEFGIDEIMNNAKIRANTRGANGMDLGEVKGGQVLPISPSADSGKIELPDESLFMMMARYRSSGKLPPLVMRGFKGNGKYGASAANLRRSENAKKFLAQTGLRAEDLGGEDELMRVMYSMVTDSMDGTGAVHRYLSGRIGGSWRWLHKNFTRAVLSLQPIRWMQKVVLFEEQVRAALMGMPNVFTNPYRAMLNFTHARQIAKSTQWRHLNNKFLDEVVQVFDNVDPEDTEELVRQATRILGISETKLNQLMNLERYKGLDFVGTVRKIVKDRLQDIDDLEDVNLGANTIKRSIRRTMRKEANVEAKNLAIDLPADFTWDQVDDIAGRSLFAEYGQMFQSLGPLAYHSNLDQVNRNRFVRAWVTEIQRIIKDPAYRLGLHAQKGASAKLEAIRSVKAAPWYPKYKTAWGQVLEHQYGVKNLDELTEDEFIGMMLDHFGEHGMNILRPFVNAASFEADEAYTVTRISQILNDEEFTFTHGQARDKGRSLKINLSADPDVLHTRLNSYLAEQKGDKFFEDYMPRSVETPFKETIIPRTVFEGGNKFKRAQNWILRRFGEDATQAINRRPAWLFEYNNQRRALDALGVPEEIADNVARTRASEVVNNVYFNNDHMTPLVRKMNGIIPFFGATVEVLSTWFYKIPFAESWAYGPLQLVKKIDRALDALRAIGFLNVEVNEGDETLGRPNARMQMQLWKPGTDQTFVSPLGGLASEWGYRFATIPASVLQGIFNVRNWLAEDNIFNEADVAAMEPDLLEFDIGNPLDISRQNSGLGAVNQLIATPSPAIKAAIRGISNLIGPVSDNKTFIPETGESVADAAKRLGVTPEELVFYNKKALQNSWGKASYAGISNDQDWTAKLPDIALEVPGTSLYDEFIHPLMYPFGSADSAIQSYIEYIPSTYRYILRGLALAHGALDKDFWSVNSDGELDLDNPFMEIIAMPTRHDRTAVAANVVTAIQEIEAEDASLSDIVEKAQELDQLVEEAIFVGAAYEDDSGNLQWNPQQEAAYQRRFEALATEIEQEQTHLLGRAFRRAAGQNMVRGMMGWTQPVTPRLLSEEQLGIEAYWTSRDAATENFMLRDFGGGRIAPNTHNFPEGGEKNVARFNDLMAAWLSDGSGDNVRAQLRKHLPELWAFTFGKTYFGEVGPPIETTTLDQHMELIESGIRDPYLPEVWIQRVMRGGIETEKEVALTETFGNEAIRSASNIITNWAAYKDIINETQQERSAMDYWDDLHGGVFDDWRNRNRDDEYILSSEARRRFDDSLDVLDQLDELMPMFFSDDPAEEAEATKLLAGISARFRDLYDASTPDRDPAYLNPREAALNWYFRQHVSPYYEEIGLLGEQLSEVTSDEERSVIFDQIRDVQDRYSRMMVRHPAGVVFPNVMDWRWSAKTPEEQEEQLVAWLVDKPVEFMNLDQISRIRKVVPSAAPYLPANESQYQMWVDYGRIRQDINNLTQVDSQTEGPLLSDGLATKAKDELERQVRDRMLAAGLSDQLQWLDLYPVEKLAAIGMLPDNVSKMAEYATAIRLQLEATDHTVGENEIKRALIDPFYMQHVARMETDEDYFNFFTYEIGKKIYDEIDRRTVFNSFFFGIWKPY